MPVLVAGVCQLRKSRLQKTRAAKIPSVAFPTFSIIVPAREEENVIGRILDSLLNLDYPIDAVEIAVVEGGSADKTTEICRSYVTRYPNRIRLFHQSSPDGKPSALNCALKHLKHDIVCVFDADNVVERDALLRVAQHFEDKAVVAVQGRPFSLNADQSMLSKLVSYEEAVRYETYVRGKDALNLFVPLTGSCYFVRRRVLEHVGGWDGHSLSEDMELAARLTEKGLRIRYAGDVRSWQEDPACFSQLFRQRVRWFRGSMEVSLKYGRLLRNPTRRNLDAEVTLAAPYMFLPFVLGLLLGFFSLIFQFHLGTVLTLLSQGLALVDMMTLFLIGLAFVYLVKPRRLDSLLWLPFVYAYWIIQNVVALYAFGEIILRRPRKWTKTKKTGTATVKDHELSEVSKSNIVCQRGSQIPKDGKTK